MQFNHYGGEAAHLAADLANTPAPHTAATLTPLLAARGITWRDLTDEHAAEIGTWVHRLADCFGPRDVAARCRAVNALLDDAVSRPQISLHDGHPHLHYSADDADPATRIRAITATGLAYVVCFAGPDRLGRCARESCGRAFVDTSRNGRRAYCSVRCANNDAVARHRRRTSAGV